MFRMPLTQRTSQDQSGVKRDRSHAHAPAPSPPAPPLLRLQQTIGNQTTGRLIQRTGQTALQTKLVVNTPGDAYEQEADRVSEQVLRMPTPASAPVTEPVRPPKIQPLHANHKLHRQPLEEEEQDEELLQAKETPGRTPQVTPNLQAAINAVRGTGHPLPQTARSFFEPRFGHDLSQVRIHTDARAARSAKSMNARAYTIGRDVVFGQGQYSTGTKQGKRLLAHELTHVIQQGGRRSHYVQRQTLGDPYFPRSTNYAFDTFNLRESHLSDPDIIARLNALTIDGLIDYRNRVADPAVQEYISGLIAARTPVLLRVEVAPGSRNHFAQVPGTGSGTHWVGVASRSATKPKVRAVVSPAVPSTDPLVAGLTWSGPGVTPDPGNPLQAEIDRTAGRRPVTATLRGVSASTTLWSVFATIRTTAGPTDTFTTDATAARPGGTVDFEATIHPNSILTAPDRPDLSGGNDTDPPGGNHWSGDPLAGGADHHWDFSRKMRTRVINPSGIPEADFVVPGDPLDDFFANRPAAYPTVWEEGNDDRATGDENNDPYTSPMTSTDPPGMLLSHGAGADGDTFEIRLHFREFVRLEIIRRWWVISAHFPWRVHMRVRKDSGRWVDNGTDAAADNTGF